MIKRILTVVFVTSIICFGVISVQSTGTSSAINRSNQEAESNIQWVDRCLKQMETIKPGMTRSELLKVFMTEGGLSTGLSRAYVYRQCPYFKVDVQFKPVGRAPKDRDGRVTLVESDSDVITKISKPYIARIVLD